jgi:hypothetical protein
MNRRGQVIFYTFMLAIVIVVVNLALVPVVKDMVTDSRNTTTDTRVGLDCSNSSISDFNKSQCVLTDLATPYFFFGILGIALLVIGARVLL